MCFQSASTYTAVVSRHLISIVSLAVKDVALLVETTLFVLYICTKRTLCTIWLYKTTCIGRCSLITFAVDARMNFSHQLHQRLSASIVRYTLLAIQPGIEPGTLWFQDNHETHFATEATVIVLLPALTWLIINIFISIYILK